MPFYKLCRKKVSMVFLIRRLKAVGRECALIHWIGSKFPGTFDRCHGEIGEEVCLG